MLTRRLLFQCTALLGRRSVQAISQWGCIFVDLPTWKPKEKSFGFGRLLASDPFMALSKDNAELQAGLATRWLLLVQRANAAAELHKKEAVQPPIRRVHSHVSPRARHPSQQFSTTVTCVTCGWAWRPQHETFTVPRSFTRSYHAAARLGDACLACPGPLWSLVAPGPWWHPTGGPLLAAGN